MGVVQIYCQCYSCGVPMACNPIAVPSLVVNGEREPICESCFNRWNQIHRTSKGLDPVPLLPDAYGACDESDLHD